MYNMISITVSELAQHLQENINCAFEGQYIKSRDITLPTKVRLVKAIVFQVIMYGCESWIKKKAECQRIDAFEL